MPAASQAATTSASRTDPPGWTIAFTPASMRICGPSAKGKNASDAFFPFEDGPQILLDAGVTAIVQPGGSVRDELTVKACEAAGVTMYLTGTRHFAH